MPSPTQIENRVKALEIVRALAVQGTLFNMASYSECGTPACAMGYLAQDRHFNQQGVSLQDVLFWEGSPVNYGALGVHLFGISLEVADRLFGVAQANAWQSNHVSPAEWLVEANHQFTLAA